MDIINFFTEMPERTRAFIGILFVVLTSGIIAFVKSKLFQEMLTGIFNFIGTKRENKSKVNIDPNTVTTTVVKTTPTTPTIPSAKGYAIMESDIINHDFFNYVDFWLYNQIPSITLSTQYRTAVFRKYLHIYYKTYRDLTQDFVRNGSYKKMNSSELRKSLLHLITDIIRHMESEMRQIHIPEVIIVKMKNVLIDRVNLTVDLINSICDSSFYDGKENYLKIYSFLNIIHSILDNTMSNVTIVCDEINGELSGLSIVGFTEPSKSSGGHNK